jgi:transcriptional regulator with XRE-family HTH domain
VTRNRTIEVISAGLTRAQLAETMGVTPGRVSQIERAELSTIEAIAPLRSGTRRASGARRQLRRPHPHRDHYRSRLTTDPTEKHETSLSGLRQLPDPRARRGARICRLPSASRDFPGLFWQAEDSPIDSRRPGQTVRISLTRKRSLVQIQYAHQVFLDPGPTR